MSCIDPYGFVRTNCDGNLYDEEAPNVPNEFRLPDFSKYTNPARLDSKSESENESLTHQLVPLTDDEWSGINPFETSHSISGDLASGLRYAPTSSYSSERSNEVPEPSLLLLSALSFAVLAGRMRK